MADEGGDTGGINFNASPSFDPTTGTSGIPSSGFTMPTMTSTTAPVMGFGGGGGAAAGAGGPTFGSDSTGGGMVFGGGAAGAGSPGPAAIGTGAAPISSQPLPDIGGGGSQQFSGPAPSAFSSDPSLSPQDLAALQSSNPAALATAQNVLNASDPNAPAGGTGAPAAGGGGGAGGAAGGGNSVLNAMQHPSLESILSAFGGNIGPLAGAGILAYEAANKPGGLKGAQLPAGAQPGPVSNQLVGQATNLGTTGAALQQPLVSGVLPPGAQASIDQLTQSEIARIKSQFGEMGLSGSTMEAQAIAQAQQSAQARAFQIAQNMAQLGLSDMSASSQIFEQLLNSGLQSDQQFQTALSQFAAALAGGGGTTVRIG